MNDHAGQSTLVWMATETLPSFPILAKNEHADVCIVGAGVAGLATAYLLGRAGRSVIILDDGPIVSGETERTTAHLVTALDNRYSELERLHGENGARLAAESHAAAIDTIAQAWDCPFHGSRFDKFGKVLNGPAITNLPAAASPNMVESGKGRPDMEKATRP
jgi:threonine dehydrogenase-like Zn-dependent dehydrogenase